MLVAVIASGTPARADDYFHPRKSSTVVTARVPRERSGNAKLLLGGLVAGMAISIGVGAYYNLDSRSASHDVSSRTPTGKSWSAELQATYDRAHTSGIKAEIGYGVAGAFAIGALIALWQTEPGEDVVDYKPQAMVTPTPGGAVVGARWGF
jgi:hypothetical protein